MAKGDKDPVWHHYVPQTYLKHFCDGGGTVLVHAKDREFTPIRLRPNSTGAAKDYYSWERSDNKLDRRAFEQIFSEHAEGHWNHLVRKFQTGVPLEDADLEPLATFVCLQHARVPAVRDGVEQRLAASVIEEVRSLHTAGELPPLPAGLQIEDLVVPIDPSTSLETLEQGMDFARLAMNRVTFRVVHNDTGREFLTSDNPVIWFDPSTVHSRSFSPYLLAPGGPTVFILPVSPSICLYGSSMDEGYGWNPVRTTDVRFVEEINEMVVRFAHRWVYSHVEDSSDLVARYKGTSPVVREKIFIDLDGNSQKIWQWAFGAINKKPKWRSSGGGGG